MTDLENLNRDTFNTSLEHITDEEAKNDIIFSQESMGGQEIDDKKGKTMEETKAEAQAMDNETLKMTIDNLLEKYINLKKEIKRAEGNRENIKNLKSWLIRNIENLQKMQRDLKRHTYSNLSTYKVRVGELIYYYEHYEHVRQILVLGQQTSDNHTIIESKQDAKRARRQETRDAKYQQRMNEILHDAALKSMLNNDMERY